MAAKPEKKYRKGEALFKEGDVTDRLFIIERGKVSLVIERSGKRIEIASLGKNQVLGEQSLFSKARQSFTAEAATEVEVMEVPVALVQRQFEQSPPGVKLLLKSMVEEAKASRQTMRSMKMAAESSPCPQVSIPRIFCIFGLVAKHTGELAGEESDSCSDSGSVSGSQSQSEDLNSVTQEQALEGLEALKAAPEEATVGEVDESPDEKPLVYKVDFGTIKLYTARMFAESPQRMRSLMDLLLKIGILEMVFVKNEDDEEELDHVIIKDLQLVEDFAEFYQYHLYKGVKSETIYPDPLAYKVGKAFVEISRGVEPDHRGAINLDHYEVVNSMKAQHKIDLNNTHIDALERKGLFVQRVPDEDKTWLRFDREEFEQTLQFWEIILEIDAWNEKGFVDLAIQEEAVAEDGSDCPSCGAEIQSEHKFCPNCGHALQAA